MRRALLLAGLLLVGCAGEEEDSALVEEGLGLDTAQIVTGDALSDAAFRFCHEKDVDAREARAFCELLADAPPEQCPGLRETCAPEEDPPAPPVGCNGNGGGGRSRQLTGPGEPEPPDAPSTPLFDSLSCDCTSSPELGFLEAIAGVLQWFVALVIAVIVVGVAALVLRFVLALVRRDEKRVESVSAPELEVAIDLEDEAVPELPSQDLLGAARAALEEGRHGDAVLLARAAALRRLGEAGRLRIHRSRTDREYVRALRRDAEVHGPLREVVRAVEWLRWGGSRPGVDDARAVLAAAERVIQAAGVLLLGALLLGPRSAVADDAWSPWGDAGLRDAFEAQGFEVGYRLRSIRSIDDTTDILVVDADDLLLIDEDWAALRTWVEQGGLLIVAGDASGLPELGSREALVSTTPAAGWGPATDVGMAVPHWPGGPDWGWSSPTGQWWVSAGAPRRAVAQALTMGEGGVVAIADARLLTNGALVSPRNEAFVAGAPYVGQGLGLWELQAPLKVELATIAGEAAQDPVTSLLNARLLPLVAQLMILLAVGALWLGWPFAPPRDPPEEGRHAFREHVTAVGERYARIGASRHAAARTADLWLQRIGPRALEDAAVRAGRPREEARAFVQQLQDLVDQPEGPSSSRDMHIMEELWRITRHR